MSEQDAKSAAEIVGAICGTLAAVGLLVLGVPRGWLAYRPPAPTGEADHYLYLGGLIAAYLVSRRLARASLLLRVLFAAAWTALAWLTAVNMGAWLYWRMAGRLP